MMGMPAAFRPRFRRGGADAEPQGDATEENAFEAAGDEVGDEVVGDLTDAGDADVGDDAGDDAGEWLAYEFHEWSLESRVMLQQLLTVDQVVHSWQGTTLMVHESLEATVDSLVDEVEETEKAKEAIARPIGPEDPLTAFELSEWPEALRAELMERLVQARVPHILDTEGDTDTAMTPLRATPTRPTPALRATPTRPTPALRATPTRPTPALRATPTRPTPALRATPTRPTPALRATPTRPTPALRATPTRPTPALRATPTRPTPALRATPTRPTPALSRGKSATCWSARRTRSGLSL